MSYASLPSSCSSRSTKRSLVALSTATAAAARERCTIPVAQLIFPFPLEPTHDSGDEKEERRPAAPPLFPSSSPLPLLFIPPRLILLRVLIFAACVLQQQACCKCGLCVFSRPRAGPGPFTEHAHFVNGNPRNGNFEFQFPTKPMENGQELRWQEPHMTMPTVGICEAQG